MISEFGIATWDVMTPVYRRTRDTYKVQVYVSTRHQYPYPWPDPPGQGTVVDRPFQGNGFLCIGCYSLSSLSMRRTRTDKYVERSQHDCVTVYRVISILGFAGLFLSLRGTPIDNDGFVDADDIGGLSNALLCLTNNTNCCGPGDPNVTGEWYFPNGVVTESITSNTQAGRIHFYFRNRGPSVVRLNRNNYPTKRGRFHCELLGSAIHANICEYQYAVDNNLCVNYG